MVLAGVLTAMGAIAHTCMPQGSPHCPSASSIEMELWRGLMANHSFVVHPKEMNDDARFTSMESSICRYVPVRLPFTTCIQERLLRALRRVIESKRISTTICLSSSIRWRNRWLTQSTDGAASRRLLT